jgi:hypothetical protein
MKEFRAESQLRELTSLESGRALADTPKGIYAYASLSSLVPPYGLLRSKLSDDEIAVLFEQYVRRATAQRYPADPRAYVELHYDSRGRLSIVGFSSQMEASHVARLADGKTTEISLAPQVVEDLAVPTSIPVERIVKLMGRTIQPSPTSYVQLLDVTVR